MENTFDELMDLKVITQVGTPIDLTMDELIKQSYITDVTVASDLKITDEPIKDEPAVEPEIEPEEEPVVDEGEEEEE